MARKYIILRYLLYAGATSPMMRRHAAVHGAKRREEWLCRLGRIGTSPSLAAESSINSVKAV
jgi:hypothetical protein